MLGINWLGEMRAVASPFHQKLKSPSPKRVVVVRGKQEDVRYYFNLAVRGSLSKKPNPQSNNQIIAVINEHNVPVKSTTKKGKSSSGKKEGKQIAD